MFRYKIIIQKWEKSTWEDCISCISYAFHVSLFCKIPYYSCNHLPLLHRSLLLTSTAQTWMAPLQLLFPLGEAELCTELSDTSLSPPRSVINARHCWGCSRWQWWGSRNGKTGYRPSGMKKRYASEFWKQRGKREENGGSLCGNERASTACNKFSQQKQLSICSTIVYPLKSFQLSQL